MSPYYNMRYCLLFLLASSIIACQPEMGGGKVTTDTGMKADDEATVGKKTYTQYCVTCHGANGKMGLNGAKSLPESQLNLDERVAIITNGRNAMQAWKGTLSPEQITAVAKYTTTLK